LFHLLVGRPPRTDAASVTQKLAAHLTGKLPLRELPTSVSAELRVVLAKMVAKDPTQRYQTPGGPDRTVVDNATGRASVPPGPENETKGLAKASWLVKKPPIAMLTAGILGLLSSLIGLVVGAAMWLDLPGFKEDKTGLVFLLSFTFDVAAGVAVATAINMRKLRRYRLCVYGSFAVILAGGIFILLGIPVGIWSLTTLRIPGMRSAFTLNEERVRDIEESIDALDRM
jgi:hypothetical protein